MAEPAHNRTVIYARQSRDHDGNALGVARQIDLSRALAQQRNLGGLLEPIIDNDVSATNGKARPGYVHLLELVQSGQVDTIVAYHLDRLLRSLAEMEELIVLCERHNVRIMTVAGDLDLSTDMGRLVGRILASVARGEVERKGRRQRDAATQAAAQGKAPSRGAFGHARWQRRGNVRYQPPAEQIAREAEAVRQAYRSLFAGRSPGSIAADLDAQGFRTTRGGQWARTEVRAMLLNPRNAGLRYLHGERVSPGDWPEIVSEETWQAAVQMLSDPARRSNPSPARRWIGSSLYRCGMCGESDMLVHYREGGNRTYRCRKYSNNTRDGAKVDDYVLMSVAQRLRTIDVVRLLDGPDRAPMVVKLRTEAAGLRRRIDDLGVDYAQGLMTGGQVKVATEQMTSRLDEIDGQLAGLGRRHELTDLLATADPGQAFLDGDLDVQRAAIKAMCTVTILPNPRGRWGVVSETVRVDFHEYA
jgi:DNA invertase Pin-like site-specific DNA recombinase